MPGRYSGEWGDPVQGDAIDVGSLPARQWHSVVRFAGVVGTQPERKERVCKLQFVLPIAAKRVPAATASPVFKAGNGRETAFGGREAVVVMTLDPEGRTGNGPDGGLQ